MCVPPASPREPLQSTQSREAPITYETDIKVTDITDVVPAGNDYVFTFTLALDNNSSAQLDGTLTADVVSEHNQEVVILNDLTLEIEDATARTASLSLTAAQTILLHTVRDFTKGANHIADIKNVEAGGAVVHYGPFRFSVRRVVTT